MIERRRHTVPVGHERRVVEEDRIDIKTPFGAIKASGNMVLLLVVILAGFGVMGFMIRDSDIRQMASFVEGRTERNQQNRESAERQNEANFILAKCLSSKEECQKLQFDMPESLRRKIGR